MLDQRKSKWRVRKSERRFLLWFMEMNSETKKDIMCRGRGVGTLSPKQGCSIKSFHSGFREFCRRGSKKYLKSQTKIKDINDKRPSQRTREEKKTQPE